MSGNLPPSESFFLSEDSFRKKHDGSSLFAHWVRWFFRCRSEHFWRIWEGSSSSQNYRMGRLERNLCQTSSTTFTMLLKGLVFSAGCSLIPVMLQWCTSPENIQRSDTLSTDRMGSTDTQNLGFGSEVQRIFWDCILYPGHRHRVPHRKVIRSREWLAEHKLEWSKKGSKNISS